MEINSKGKILIIYYYDFGYPLLKMNEDLLRCFERYSSSTCYYINVFFGVPSYIFRIQFDIIIYHDLMLCKRSLPKRFDLVRRRTQPLLGLKGHRLAMVQDEFLQTSILNDYLEEHQIKHIFSVAPESEWGKIYPRLYGKAKFEHCLTGYIDEVSFGQIRSMEKEGLKRKTDICYRAFFNKSYFLGSHGLLKGAIADVVKEAAVDSQLNLEISTNPKDLISGANWYRFLLSSKYVLGVESGSSVLDTDGSIERKVHAYLKKHPDASYAETESACFPGVDGNLKLFTIGPRHLEACMTKTCQLLVEGEYNGILQPWKHYIPIKRDFSNIREVLEIVKKDELREAIVENAYKDIVESGAFSYRAFVNNVIQKSCENGAALNAPSPEEMELFQKNIKREARNWQVIKYYSRPIKGIINSIPRSWYDSLLNVFR